MGAGSGLPVMLQTIGTIFGLFAGLATLLYIAGGAIFRLRLWAYQLPSELTVSELPQPLLATIALSDVFLPSVMIAAVYLALRVVFWPHDVTRRLFDYSGDANPLPRASWYASRAGVLLAVVVLALIAESFSARRNAQVNGSLLFWILSTLGCFTGALIALRILMIVHDRHRQEWNRPIAVGWATMLIGLAALPIWVVNGGTAALPQGRACGPDGVSVVALGWLLGETSDRIYFGGLSPSNGPYVVWVPASKVQTLVIDYDKPAAELRC
jgi:hypothetical protein